jgi:hypothetical protein
MKTALFVWISLTAMSLFACTSFASTSAASEPAGALVETVRQATDRFHDIREATKAGYVDPLLCVSGPEEGAMGIHFANDELVGDGDLDPERPELLVYEPKNGQLHLVAVEYIVLAEAWDANNPAPPSLPGQLFHYVGSPNRFGLPAFYELHVWAWKHNPHGTFADWNPRVSCAGYTPGGAAPSPAGAHGAGH